MNLSQFSHEDTATTCSICALQRAMNLAVLGVKTVLELCVGPSLPTLERAYARVGLVVSGNDIDKRYQTSYKRGKWIIGDARLIDASGFDAVVVAPPLSKGCSGRREDALSLEEVVPSYYDFNHLNNDVITYVLPGRTLSLRQDRSQLHKFISKLDGQVDIVPLRNKVVKYVDVYQTRTINH